MLMQGAIMSRLNALVRGVMAIEPDAPAIEYHGDWYRWGDLTAIINGIERIFEDEGIEPGTRVGGLLRNTPEIAALILALITGDRCVVTLNPLMPDDKLVGEIAALQLPVLVAMSDDWKRADIAAAAKRAGLLGIEIIPGAAEPVRIVIPRGEGAFRIDADGVAIEMLTSGTTGTPKRVPLMAENFAEMILDAAHFENRDPDAPPRLRNAVSILNTPFSHIGGIFGLFNCLSAGRKACMLDRFQVETFVDAIERHRPRITGAPPAALRMLLDADVPKEKLSSLMAFRTSTAPLDPDLADEFQAKYGVPVLQNYGATEFAGGVAGWTIDDYRRFPTQKRGSVGKMNPGVDGRVVDQESGAPVPHGTPGLLELRARHLGDGQSWLRTTDIARMDEDQYLWILGRADNAIIRGGFKVIPDDVVRAMETHPAIIEACVLALPDARLGQVPVAAYRERSGKQVGEDELRSFLREKLAPYQVPVRFLRLEEFPRTPSMKVSQPELRKLFETVQ